MSSQEEQQFDRAAKEILVNLVTSLLVDKPKDPVRYTNLIYFLDSLHLFLLTWSL